MLGAKVLLVVRSDLRTRKLRCRRSISLRKFLLSTAFNSLALSGWQKARRVIVLRRRLKGEVVLSDESSQLALGFLDADEGTGRYEYFVLVTSLPHEIRTVAQLYRDRADSENICRFRRGDSSCQCE
jgi:hypothetical protein